MIFVVYSIILLCVLVFVFQDYWIVENFAMVSGLFFSEPWRAVTSMFLHGSLTHILFNMFVLFMFGSVLEKRVGTSWFLLVYFISGICGSFGFELLSEPGILAVGASGAIYGVMGALVVLAPKMTIYFYGIPMPMYIAGIVYAVVELLFLGRADNIAHSAHLLGLVGGFITAKAYEYISSSGEVKW